MFRPVIGSLILLTGFSCLLVAFFPRLPAPEDPEIKPGEIQGAQVRLMEDIPGRSSLNWSIGTTRQYSLNSIENRQPSIVGYLFITGVAVRREEHLQVALITQGDQNLEMDQRRIYLTGDGNEYALGSIGGHGAVQSCKAPNGRNGVTQETLAQLMPPRPLDPQDPMGLLRRLAGMQSNRDYKCTLVTLVTPDKVADDQLLDFWRKVSQAITE